MTDKKDINDNNLNNMTDDDIINAICPPAYIPTENEIKLAKYNYAMENNIYDILSAFSNFYKLIQEEKSQGIVFDDEHKSGYYTKKEILKEAQEAMVDWQTALEKWDDDLLDTFVDKDWFHTCYTSSLSDIHCGDCTAVASSCMRCHAEERFKLENTAKWGKHQGWEFMNKYFDIMKSRKQKSNP